MNKIKELQYNDFVELVNFLNKENDKENFYAVSKRLTRFMPDLNGAETLLMENVISSILNDEDDSEEIFNSFRNECGEKTFDKDGKSEIISKTNNIELVACEMVYKNAEKALLESDFVDKTPNKVNLQIYNARNLDNLIKAKGKYEYPIRKALYFKDKKPALTKEELQTIESGIAEIFRDQKTNIMGNFLNYIYNKKPESVYYFIQHFKTRVISLSEDHDMSEIANQEFYKKLEQLI